MVVTLKGIQSQALSDLLAQFPSGEYEDLPCEETCSVKNNNDVLLSIPLIKAGGGCRVVLYDPDGADVSLSFKLKFSY